jgi:hypothetical protein
MRQRVEEAVQRVTLHFDPACPWTWRTSRWLVEAAAARSVPVEYAALELSAGKPIDELPPQRRTAASASRAFLRGVTAARRQGRHDLIGRWYTAFGSSRWNDDIEPTNELVQRTLTSAGGGDLLAALDDDDLDEAMAATRCEALEWAGDEAGSPVTVWDIGDLRRGFFGPVVAPQPSGSTSDGVWVAVVNAATSPEFFELKARRTHTPTEPPDDEHS